MAAARKAHTNYTLLQYNNYTPCTNPLTIRPETQTDDVFGVRNAIPLNLPTGRLRGPVDIIPGFYLYIYIWI